MSEELKRLKSRYEEYLLGVKGVTGVGVNGSIIVYVDKVTTEIRQVVPRQLEGVPVKIVESRFKLMSLRIMDAVYASRTRHVRPVVGGISIGHPLVSAGTLACRVLNRKTGEVMGGLTNNHIAALNWGELEAGKVGDSILQPGPYDGGLDPDDSIGELAEWVPVSLDKANLVDAAVFHSSAVEKRVLDVGTPRHTIEPREGMTVVKSGRTSGVTFGRIMDVSATLKIDGGAGWGECLFKDQIVISPAILSPGDSGSWVGEVETFNTVGLGFAGSDTLSVANKALMVEELLDVEIEPPTKAVSLFAMAGFWIGVLGVGYQILQGVKK